MQQGADTDSGTIHVLQWFEEQGWQAFAFQQQAWAAYAGGGHGLLNAPTGSGKTYALGLAPLISWLNNPAQGDGLRMLWITPLRALSRDIQQALQRACLALEVPWTVACRNGDTDTKTRQQQLRQLPQILVTTPESLHLLLALKDYARLFAQLDCLVVDEWHELLGSKRGVQVELAASRLRALRPQMRVWGISATIGNMEEAAEVLLGPCTPYHFVSGAPQKKLHLHTLLPDSVDDLPWYGHMGLHLLPRLRPVLDRSPSNLVFTNTRAQSEIWYQHLLNADPDLAGWMALHHSNINRELRDWVEDSLHHGRLKVVVCTSSLDLGVDFRPVEQVVQVGSPKGVARFVQRAGRSGHRPGAESHIWFLPTHALELVEGAALRQAVTDGIVEARQPYVRCWDVLVQYLVTLAVGDGFYPDTLLPELRATNAYATMSDDEWQWCLRFISSGGDSLTAYDEFNRVEIEPDGRYVVKNRRTATRHRMGIGTIVSEQSMWVKLVKGKRLGTVEEYFIAGLQQGDVFWFAGQHLEFVRIQGFEALVQPSKKKKGKVPSWAGGRMPLSSQMSSLLRDKIAACRTEPDPTAEPELHTAYPLLQMQAAYSAIPAADELLIETYRSEEGYHLYVYPFEGRLVNEGMAALLAYRLSLVQPISFTLSMSDYGFEMLSDQEIPLHTILDNDLLSEDHLLEDIQASVNLTEMARRRFRDIATIAGLVFSGYPGQEKTARHLQGSAQLFFDVFRDYEPTSLLLRQAYQEVLDFQLEEGRLRQALQRIAGCRPVVRHLQRPSPLCFPLLADSLNRNRLSSESLEDRIMKMQLALMA